MLPNDVVELAESHLGSPIIDQQAVGGGCIANASRIETERESYFLKWSREEAAQTFLPEAQGLNALREARAELHVPEPIAAVEGTRGKPGILVTEWIESGHKEASFWEEFGRALAALHGHSVGHYGFDSDNFIGRLPQKNEWAKEWTDFFLTRRLEPQVRMASERGRWESAWNSHLERLFNRVDVLLPAHPEASVLHGDLWGGNFLVAGDGHAALVDPAAYYGHREADVAMTRLFGGFEAGFYDAYLEAWPLEPGYEERFDVYNLYHLINHLNHFGSGYSQSVERILRRYG